MTAALRTRPSVVRQHMDALHISSELTSWFRKVREPHVLYVTVENVIRALHRAGIRCVLLGTHGLVGYRSQSRATDDVDVLVTKREVRKAVRVLDATFPYLEPLDTAVVTRFRDPVTQKIFLDVMKPTSRVMQVAFRNTIPVGKTHRIPTLEMALVLKFVAMRGPMRRMAKRLIDAGDFVDIVVHNRAVLDLKKLQHIADGVYPNGGELILRLVQDIDAGQMIQLETNP